MPDITLRELINTFTEQELDLIVPIDFQDVSADDYELVNEYNAYLANGNFDAALQFRNANADVLDKYIFDAKKMNMLQSMVINAYLFAKDEKAAKYSSYDNSNTGLEADNVQEAIDETFRTVNNTIETNVAELNENAAKTPQDLNIVAYTVTGAAEATTSLKDGEITEIALKQETKTSDNEEFIANEDGGIRIYEYGWYLISASAYIKSDAANGRIARSIFVMLDNGTEETEILSSTETVYDTSKGVMGAIATATKLIHITQDHMDQDNESSAKISLHARSKGADGTVDNDNHSTFLTVVRIGSPK